MSLIVILFILCSINATIDVNIAELRYLADHLTPLECRRLVAALHFKSFNIPNSLDQAERKVPTDETCLQLLLHWNSKTGEGRGETHELLEHRLRQIGKGGLADWLGKTVFKQLGNDLERGISEGFNDILSTSVNNDTFVAPTLQPIVKIEDPSEYTMIDSILYALAAGLLLLIVGLCIILVYGKICRKNQTKIKRNRYNHMEDPSDTDSEDRFDVRDHVISKNKLINRHS